jgi:hypothetical protein
MSTRANQQDCRLYLAVFIRNSNTQPGLLELVINIPATRQFVVVPHTPAVEGAFRDIINSLVAAIAEFAAEVTETEVVGEQ